LRHEVHAIGRDVREFRQISLDVGDVLRSVDYELELVVVPGAPPLGREPGLQPGRPAAGFRRAGRVGAAVAGLRRQGTPLPAPGSQDGTVRLWTTGSEEPPAEQLGWHRQEADACAGAGRWAEALWHLDRLLRLEPGRGATHARRGFVRAGLRNWDAALADLAR